MSSGSYKAPNSWQMLDFYLEILFCFPFIHLRQGVLYIVNKDRNFVLYCFDGIYHGENFGTVLFQAGFQS